MNITKYGHSCLLVEVNGVRIITDPGKWNPAPDADNVHAILITHEHQDHFDVGQLREILERNPDARVITHAAVGEKLSAEGISYETIAHGERVEVNGVGIESFGTEHACIYGDVPPCKNTGYLINDDLFAPGDALHDIPSKPVRVLALPCGGPWMRLSEAIDYAKRVQPAVVFPIHDAMYVDEFRDELIPRIVGGNLATAGIDFVQILLGTPKEF